MDGQITRRTLLGATAVGGAALLGTSSIASAGAPDPGDDGFLSGDPTVAAASASAQPLALPVAAGAQATTLGYLDFRPTSTAGPTTAGTLYSGSPDRTRSEP